MRWTLGAIGAFAGCLLVAGDASASPEDLFGYGGRTSAMGATGTAHATGYETAWHNPALASSVRKNQLTLGWGGGVFRLDGRGDGFPGRMSASAAKGFVVGAEIPIPFGGTLRDRVGITLGFYTPSDVIVRGRVLYPDVAQYPVLPDRAQSVTIRGALGTDIGYGIKLGVGFAALAELVGTVVAATDATGRVGTSVETQLVATYAPTAGISYDLPKDTKMRLGLTVRGTLDARFAVVIDGTKLSTLPIPLFNISGLAQYDPAQVALEAARTEALNTLALQLVYKNWSSFPGILEPTIVCNEGGAGACGIVPPTIPWRDTFVVRIGAEQGFTIQKDVIVFARGGAFFESSPLPSSIPGSEAFDTRTRTTGEVPTRYLDANRVALTMGTGVSIAPVTFDLFTQYHVLLPRTIKSIGAAGQTLSEAEASGHVVVFGLTGGVKF
jgi:long-chain fatty acid transport protein